MSRRSQPVQLQMSRKDKQNRNSYFSAKRDSSETKFDISDEDFAAFTDGTKKKPAGTGGDTASKVPLPVEFEESGSRFSWGFLKKTGAFIGTVPSFLFNGMKRITLGFAGKVRSLFASFSFVRFSFPAFWKRRTAEESLEDAEVQTARQPEPKRNPSVMKIAEMPTKNEEDEDGRYFGNWLSIAGKTAVFAASLLLLTGIYFGSKAIYTACLKGNVPAESAVQNDSAPSKEQNAIDSVVQGVQTDSSAKNEPKQNPEQKPETAAVSSSDVNPLETKKPTVSPTARPAVESAAVSPAFASNAVNQNAANPNAVNKTEVPKPETKDEGKRTETAAADSVKKDPFENITATANNEPKTPVKPEPKDLWLTDIKSDAATPDAVKSDTAKSDAKPENKNAAQPVEPSAFDALLKEENKPKPSELAAEPSEKTPLQTNSTAQSSPPAVADLWGTGAAAPETAQTEVPTGFSSAPLTASDTKNPSTKNDGMKNDVPTNLLAPMKKIDGAAETDALSSLKPMKTVGAPPVSVSANNPVPGIPKQNPPQNARTFASPSVPPAMDAAIQESALNSIPAEVPLPHKTPRLQENTPAIPRTDDIQNFAAVKTEDSGTDEKRPAIPAGDAVAFNTLSSGAVKFQPLTPNRNNSVPAMEIAASAPAVSSRVPGELVPAIPHNVPMPTNDSSAVSVPAPLPPHQELAKTEPPIGSQLQNGIQEQRSQEGNEPKISFGGKQIRAIRYSPESVSSEPLPVPDSKTPAGTAYTPLPMPTSPDDPQSNSLLSLLPNNNSPSPESAPSAMMAPINPGYYHRSAPSEPAAVSSEQAAAQDTRAVSLRQQLEDITKSPKETETYTVQSGDSYYTICERFFDTGLLFRALAEHNRLRFGTSYRPQPGTVIEVPTADYLKSNYMGALQQKNRPERTVEPSLTQNPQPGRRYIVQEGDTVFGIATNILRDTPRWKEIVALNQDRILSPRQSLRPGMELILP